MSKTTDELYMEHLDEMFDINSPFTDEAVERILNRMLLFLPNGGKLYKYRSMEGTAFDNAFDSLKNGYLWLPKAEDLNDDEDTVLYYDPLKSVEEIKEYIFSHPYEFMGAVISSPERKFKIGKTKKDEFEIKCVCNCFDRTTGVLDEHKAILRMVKNGIPKEKAVKQLNILKAFIESYPKDNIKAIESLAEMHLSYNKRIRSQSYIYSLSEDYDNDQLWAYYANSNNGFCIEYDFNKCRELPVDTKRNLISLYKVKYKEAEEYSFKPLIEWFFDGRDSTKYSEENKKILNQLITKKIGWQQEKEWRLFLSDTENKLFADIVSGIIIDERTLGSENSNMLISLSEARGWDIRIRRKNKVGTKHIYEALNTEVQ